MEEIQAIAVDAALSAFGLDAQHDRLLRIDFPHGDGPDRILLVNRLRAHEEVSRCFRFDVELLSDNAHILLKPLMGRMVTISLVREDGSLRYFNGYVTEFRFVRTDGGFAFYRMVLEPWLAFARLRKDNVSFHGKTVVQMTELTFAHYRQADWHAAILGEDLPITCANQYDETDYNHLHRRWEALGLAYWYEHREDGHTLWLMDKSTYAEAIDPHGIDDSGEIPFRDKTGSLEDDGIHEWSAIRRIGSGQTTLASFDYKNPVAQRSSADSLNDQGDVFPHEVYEDMGSYGFRTHFEGEQRARRRMDEQDANTQYFEARGNDRNAQSGRYFTLADHFSAEPQVPKWGEAPRRSIADRHYLILSVDHEASNNYQAGRGAPSHYANTFRCVRKDLMWRPGRYYNSRPCSDPGIQTALVVGPSGAEIHTDEYGRIKVQFHWDRLGAYDENSSPWLRVMSSGAGSEFGNIRLPRVGEEVSVVFLNGNIDHPMVLGVLHNYNHMPPWQLPQQKALSGLRSRELEAGEGGHRGNHLVLDDTPGKIQVQLKSDHQCSQLSLGHIARIEDTSGRQDERGEGWELRTDGHGVARAGQGMLITTEARPNGDSHIKDMGETIKQLSTATELQEQMGKLAQHYGAQENQELQQNDTVNDLQSQNQAFQGGGTKEFPELAEPHLVVTSPAGIELSSAQSTHIASNRHTAITSGKSLSIASAEGLFASIGKTFRLFVHKAGMRLIAAGGKVSVQAQNDDVEVIANKVLALLSESDWVDIRGKKGVRLHGANHVFEISDKTQFFTSSPVLFHGNLETLPPKNISAAPEQKRQAFTVAPSASSAVETDHHLESTFAFNQIEQVAKNFTYAEFVMFLAPIFGYDIPAETYIKLHEELRNGSIKQPAIKVMRSCHYPASFDNETREILVHQTAADRAAAGNDHSWELLTALIHEFGHYIDLVLRKDLAEKNPDGTSTLKSDAEGDEGAKFAYNIAFFDFCNTGSTTYAIYRSPAFDGELKVDYHEVQQAIKKSQDEDAQHNEGKEGNVEFFGAGLGEHHKERPTSSFGHQSIEHALLNASINFKDEDTLKKIYFGNWLRDYSQLLDPSIVRKPEAPRNFPTAFSRQELTELVDIFAELEFVQDPKKKQIFKVTPSILGVYRPVEHIDNPTNNSTNTPDPHTIDKDFQPKASAEYTSIDPTTSMKRYIDSSATYMSGEINKALVAGPGPEGYRHFGAALHVLEDYFAHSNFVELSLRKVGHVHVLPWTSPTPGKHNLPVVTGMFDSDDVIASTAGTIADIVFKVEWKFTPIESGERTKADRVLLILLRAHSDPRVLQAYEDYLKIRDNLAKIPGYKYMGIIPHYTVGLIANINNFVYSTLLHLVGNSVDDQQIVRVGDPNTNGSTNPTHSQLAKDHDNHPFHTLAAELAKIAVTKVGSAVADRWWNGDTAIDPALIARGFLTHPFDTNWQDKLVTDWAVKHPKEVKRGESATEWEAIEKAHKKEVLDSINRAKKMSQESWDYINKNFTTLFKEKNQIKK
ncbi:type VI secretion system tip protein VgrG [Massilia forsythiae]|uniref:Type VI secretion system tip protein VgrG n=1 Tax=Massilia forsythiae TaxID=2728020 RepID=A0A7Z2ZSN5_9BURK|nr:type VI secretion system tip protein TssI/VgrG [Massilia forsythiae]QJE00688.1 type VI secretion system tip protein VgrG [Massilia forsythiae]